MVLATYQALWIASALPGMEGPRQCGSGLAEAGSCEAEPLSSQLDETERT